MNLRLSWRKNWPDVEALLRGGFPSFVLQRNPVGLPDGVPVFCYHAADPAGIEADFSFLKENGYVTVTADEVGAVASDKTVALTVDDGAQDLYSVLFPALKKYGFQATAFVSSAFPMYRGTDDVFRCAQALGYATFWWGTLPGRRANQPDDPPTHRVRVSAEFVRRLSGTRRVPLVEILRGRLLK